MPKGNRKAARNLPKPKPPGVSAERLGIIKRLAAHGYLMNEIADILGVSRQTMWRWRAQFPEVTAALAIGHEAANNRVELAVYQMAIGYDREEIEIKVVNGEVVEVPVRRYYPPNPRAAEMWTRHKMSWGEDIAPMTEAPDETKPIEIRTVARQVARLLHLANKESAQ